MEKLLLTVLILFCFISTAYSQDEVLSIMKQKSFIVAHVRVIEIMGGMMNEAGVLEWSCLCEIIEPIKGHIEKGGKLRIFYQTFSWQNKKELPIFEKKKEYIVFLKKGTGQVKFSSDDKLYEIYNLIDHWVGVLPYNPYLPERLIKYID